MADGKSPMNCAAFSPDGSIIASGDSDGVAQLWSASTGKSIAVVKRYDRPVYQVSFHAREKLLSTQSRWALDFWAYEPSEEAQILEAVLRSAAEQQFARRLQGGKMLVDNRVLKNFTSPDRRLVLGDFSKVQAEFRKIEQRPGYHIEIQFTNWQEALKRAFPECQSYLIFGDAHKSSNGHAVVEYSIGPPGIHGPDRYEHGIAPQTPAVWPIRRLLHGHR